MELSEVNKYYLSNLLKTLSNENKTLVLHGDFNADLLKYGKDCNISNFLDIMYSIPLLSHPTRVTVKSGTINDYIFTKNDDSSFTSGNLVTTLPDHHAQFLLIVSQTREIHNENNQAYRDFTEINTH